MFNKTRFTACISDMLSLSRSILCMVVLVTGIRGSAQQFGGNPPFVSWRQVNNETVRVIFPKDLDSVAKEVAGIVQHLNSSTKSSIGDRQRKVNMILQHETTVSNGYVSLGPFRSEFFLTPFQNSFRLGSLPWHKHLAIHEFRHVQQYNNFNTGLSRAFRMFFGEEGQALANSLVIADWFFEGDAVFNETSITPQGRGRLPYFHNGYRSLWADDKNYSWMKLRNGSLRDYTPDHYPLGYLLVAYGREKYGEDFWKKVTQDAASYKGIFYPFQKAVKKYSGINYVSFRKSAINHFKTQAEKLLPEPGPGHFPSRHFIADEEYPAFTKDGSVIFMKSSYGQIPVFVSRSGNKEKKIRVKDVSPDKHFSYRNGKIIYASFRPDARWGYRNYSTLKLLDVNTGSQRSVTTRTKYFSPDISEDGSRIVAVRVDPNGTPSLDILNATDGRVIKVLPNNQKLFYTYPKFLNAGKVVTAIRNPLGQMSLALIDASNGDTEYLVPFSYNVIGFPFIRNDTVYFSASHLQKDQVFAFVISSKKLYLLKHRALDGITGNYQPAVNGNFLMWSQFTSVGRRLQQVNSNDVEWQPINAPEFTAPPSNFNISALDGYNISLTPAGNAQVSRYSRSYRLLNFHTLRPLINDPLFSFSLIGENVLNTLQSELYFRYNRNERYKQLGFNATYGALFPFISAGVSYAADRRGLFRNQRIYWNEWEWRAGISLPLNLSKGRNYSGINIGTDYVYNQPNFRGVFKDSLGNRSFGYLNNYISFYNQIQQARKHIYPRFAQSLLLNYKTAVSNDKARQFLISGNVYLPGLGVNHSLVLNMAFQGKDTFSQRSYSNNFPFSRGYTSENLYRMNKWGFNYHFPLAYPDAGFGNIIYILRVRANTFYDHTGVTGILRNRRRFTAKFRSAGTELFFDTKWWNQLPLSLGVRYSYLLDKDVYGGSGRHRFEFVLPVNLLGR